MSAHWFISKKYRRHSTLALITFGLAFIVILLGAFTRLTNAGLSCPDWPHCFGFLTAPHTFEQLTEAAKRYPLATIDIPKAWTEMTHRYAAGTEGLLILWLAWAIFSERKAGQKKSFFVSLILISLVGLQVLLGKFTVTENLKPTIVLSHLVIGMTLLCTLWWIYLDLHLNIVPFFKPSKSLPAIFFWLAFAIIAIQISLGGWVSTHYADLACIDFPYCNDKLLPSLKWHELNSDLITIHMLHRLGALITTVYLIGFCFFLSFQKTFRLNALLILALLALQITLGILNIVWYRPVAIALMHHGIAILLLLAVLTVLIKHYFISERQNAIWFS